MRQDRFKLSEPLPTMVSLLLVMLIASPCLALATELDHVSMYPVKGQSQSQQGWDRYEGHSCPVEQTRFGTNETVAQAAVSTPIPSPSYHPPQRHVARGAARGAAVGAVGGAITGDPAKGAAAGAAMGGTAGAFRRRDERRQQSIQQQPMLAPPQ